MQIVLKMIQIKDSSDQLKQIGRHLDDKSNQTQVGHEWVLT